MAESSSSSSSSSSTASNTGAKKLGQSYEKGEKERPKNVGDWADNMITKIFHGSAKEVESSKSNK